MKIFRKKNSKGMTLVEVVVSATILIVGLIPVFISISIASNISIMIKNNIIAANLAQEGVEIVRSIRDSNWYNNRGFADGLIGNWRVDWTTNHSNLISSAGLESDPYISKGTASGLYGYDASQAVGTNFKRQVRIVYSDPCNCQIRVESEVQWFEQGGLKGLVVISYLYDWF
jgi:Tfp pilus assembly protein PilV